MVVSLFRGRTMVVALGAGKDAASSVEGFELTTPPLGAAAVAARTWRFRCHAPGGGARWVDRLRPWLML